MPFATTPSDCDHKDVSARPRCLHSHNVVETDQEYVNNVRTSPARPCRLQLGPSQRSPDRPLWPRVRDDNVTDSIVFVELKETHLGPLTSTFSRSPSTSTITEKDDKSQGAISGTATPTNESTIGMFSTRTPCPGFHRRPLLFAPLLTDYPQRRPRGSPKHPSSRPLSPAFSL